LTYFWCNLGNSRACPSLSGRVPPCC